MSEIDYNSINPANMSNEIFGNDTTPEKVEPKQSSPEPSETVVEDVPENDPDDTPWDDDPDESAPVVADEPEEVVESEEDKAEQARLDALEASENWRKKRLNKEIEHKRVAQEEATRLKAELEALKAERGVQSQSSNQPVPSTFDEYVNQTLDNDPEITSLKKVVADIKAKKDSFATEGDYVDALTDANTDLKTEIKFKKEILKQTVYNHQSSIQQKEADIGNQYLTKVNELKETYPKIDKAYQQLEKIADNLHVEIRRAILLDDNPGELTWQIGSSKRNLDFLLQASQIAKKTGSLPIDAIKFIGKLSNDAKKTPVEETPVAKPAIPRTIKQVSKTKDDTNEDLNDWAEKELKAGRRPW